MLQVARAPEWQLIKIWLYPVQNALEPTWVLATHCARSLFNRAITTIYEVTNPCIVSDACYRPIISLPTHKSRLLPGTNPHTMCVCASGVTT